MTTMTCWIGLPARGPPVAIPPVVAVGAGAGSGEDDDPPLQPTMVREANATSDARRKCSFFTTSWYALQLKLEL